jgi:hypothetical protein
VDIADILYTADTFGSGYDSNNPNTAKARKPIILFDTLRFTAL